jgi:hypothetical protein
MDKHDRPYRCPQTQCIKLQGFTSSGGLLRHEREVHGKHGGSLGVTTCPVAECKRHTGKPFSRVDGLVKHLTAVHGINMSPADIRLGLSSKVSSDQAPSAKTDPPSQLGVNPAKESLTSTVPTVEEIRAAIPEQGINVRDLIRPFKREVGREKEMINLFISRVKQVAVQDPSTKLIHLKKETTAHETSSTPEANVTIDLESVLNESVGRQQVTAVVRADILIVKGIFRPFLARLWERDRAPS